MIIAVLAVLAAWLAFGRYETARENASPLPGAGPGDRCAIWFIGSSTMYRWTDLVSDVAPWRALRRGVNGATFSELNERLSNDPAKVPPRAIVLYAGENDLADGDEVAEVFAHLRAFVAIKQQKFGDIPLILVSLKPSPTRWNNRPAQIAYNALIRDLASTKAEMTYVEIGPLLMDQGRPGDHYVADGIHLKPEGYRLWAPSVKAALQQQLKDPRCE